MNSGIARRKREDDDDDEAEKPRSVHCVYSELIDVSSDMQAG